MDTQPIEVGQVWRREGTQFLYEVKDVVAGAGSNIRLQKLTNSRNSWISEAGLRSKFELWRQNAAA